jgi:CDP-glycerol glycerophosphotransferase (TagB/SpsB family)
MYIIRNTPEINAIWITRNHEIFAKLQDHSLKVVMHSSLRGFYYSLVAKYFLVSHGLTDLNQYIIGQGKVIKLGHTTFVMKKNKADQSISGLRKVYRALQEPIRFLFKRIDYSICISNNVISNVAAHNDTKKENVFPLGTPKVDFYLSPNKSEHFLLESSKDSIQLDPEQTMVLFFPTYRDNKDFNLFSNGFEENLNLRLKENMITLLINRHPSDADRNVRSIGSYSNILILKETGDQTNVLISRADIFITDYSSLFADFLLFNRPLLFANFDHEDFMEELGLDIDYETLPGPKVNNWQDLVDELIAVKNGKDQYKTERNIWLDTVYGQISKNACVDIYEKVRSL